MIKFVITEEDEEGEWELAELEDQESEDAQMNEVLSAMTPVFENESDVKESYTGRQREMLERWKDYP